MISNRILGYSALVAIVLLIAIATVGRNDEPAGEGRVLVQRATQSVQRILQDPEKIRILECMGVKVFQDPQPPGHPPSQSECDRITEGLAR